ncbi:MAG: ATP-dependent DNA helicase, partial [Elusimicrobiota bacterium]
MSHKKTSVFLDELNSNQKKAVTHGTGPLLVVAGAGTGKTRVITYRIAHIISTKKAKPSEILALTFTEKAAQEMSSRIDVLVPYGFNDVWVSTFHSLGDAIIRENSLLLGLSTDFRVLSKPEAVVFFKERLFEFQLKLLRPLGNPAWNVSAILDVISRAKDEDVSPQDYEKFCLEKQKEEINRQLEIASAYKKYEELKTRNNFIDFGDQVTLTLKLFREHKSVLSKYQSKFKYILIDEFQDTNYAQFELIKLLSAPADNLTVVGDDDQSIFKFRGACLSNILNFKKHYKDCSQIVLTENYRSTRHILDTSYRLITHNNPERLEVKNKIKKKLTDTRNISGARVEFKNYDTVFTEADEVSRSIKKRIENKKSMKHSDFAILVRNNELALHFLKSLDFYGIPWKFSGARGITQRQEIKILIAFLRVVANPDDSLSLFFLFTQEAPFGKLFAKGVTQEELALVSGIAKKLNRSIYYVIKHSEKISGLDSIPRNSVNELKKAVDEVREFIEKSATSGIGQLLYKFLKEYGILQKLALAKKPDEIEIAHNIAKFFEVINNFSEIASDDRVRTFVDYITSLFEGVSETGSEEQILPESEIEYDAVNVLTVHRAKGLEFSCVYVVGLAEGIFPAVGRRSPIELPEGLIRDILPSGDEHIQEERRLFYVAMTRAKDTLNMSCALYYGGKKPRKISRFVRESLDVPVVDMKTIKPTILAELGRFAATAEKAAKQITLNVLTAPVKLTPYAIDDYITCPLKYKYIHLLKIPLPRHHTLLFGEIIHRVLKEFHISLKDSRKIKTDDFIKLYEKFWSPEGFISREHEEERFKNGRQMLVDYITTHIEGNVANMSKIPAG